MNAAMKFHTEVPRRTAYMEVGVLNTASRVPSTCAVLISEEKELNAVLTKFETAIPTIT